MCVGATSFNPVGLILIVLQALKICDYKSNLGALMVLNLFPIAIGSFFEFYKSGQINWPLAIILILSVTLGSWFGSKIVTNKNYALSNKSIEYFTGYVSILIGIAFLIGARYEKN